MNKEQFLKACEELSYKLEDLSAEANTLRDMEAEKLLEECIGNMRNIWDN